MKQHITRDYNSFLIDDKKGVITKCSSNIKLKDEIDYYKSIDTCNSIFFTRFLGTSNSGSNYKLEIGRASFREKVYTLVCEIEFKQRDTTYKNS